MKKPTKTKTHPPLLKIFMSIIGVLLGIGLLAVLIIWFLWPVQKNSLQTVKIEHLSFSRAQEEVATINRTEQSEGIRNECTSKLYVHDQPTAKAVVMFHGVSACPEQFSDLGEYFYNQGYNVYIPRTPHHGTKDNLDHAQVTSQELVDYVNTSVNIGRALGKELGVVGLSGGANLGTWAIQYRPEVKQLLALSPFYEPSAKQAPKWQIRPLLVLHGNNILPDQLNKPDDPQHALSYRALSKYVTVFKNLPNPSKDTHLKKVSLIMADDDDQIDQPLASKTLTGISKANNIPLDRYQIPASYGVEHDIVSLDNKAVAKHKDFLYKKYLSEYKD